MNPTTSRRVDVRVIKDGSGTVARLSEVAFEALVNPKS
jgi:hypothetical protein